MREQVSKMMTDAQRRAAEITDTAKAKAQEITDEAEVHRTKTISQVNAEVEQIAPTSPPSRRRPRRRSMSCSPT